MEIMRAILFDDTTLPVIIRKMKVDVTAAEYREMKESRLNKRYYFFPVYFTQYGDLLNSWVLLEEDYVFDNFMFDTTRINFQFVDIVRK